MVTFQTKDNAGKEIIQTISGGDFLWLLLRHVLPRRFRRVRDFGLLHGNGKRLIQLVQLLLRVVLPDRSEPSHKPAVLCPQCGGVMKILAVRARGMRPLLS
jgi:hypothetical protein